MPAHPRAAATLLSPAPHHAETLTCRRGVVCRGLATSSGLLPTFDGTRSPARMGGGVGSCPSPTRPLGEAPAKPTGPLPLRKTAERRSSKSASAGRPDTDLHPGLPGSEDATLSVSRNQGVIVTAGGILMTAQTAPWQRRTRPRRDRHSPPGIGSTRTSNRRGPSTRRNCAPWASGPAGGCSTPPAAPVSSSLAGRFGRAGGRPRRARPRARQRGAGGAAGGRVALPARSRCVGTVLALPYPDAGFDAVWFANTTQYLTDEGHGPGRAAAGGAPGRAGGGQGWRRHADPRAARPARPPPAPLRGGRARARAAGGGRARRALPAWLRRAGLVDVRRRTTLIERAAPLTPLARQYWRDLLALLAAARAQPRPAGGGPGVLGGPARPGRAGGLSWTTRTSTVARATPPRRRHGAGDGGHGPHRRGKRGVARSSSAMTACNDVSRGCGEV